MNTKNIKIKLFRDRKGRKKRLKRWQRVILKIFLVLMIIAVAILATLLYLRYEGEKKLKNKATSENPELNIDSSYDDEIIYNQNSDDKSYDLSYKGVKYKYNSDIITLLVLGIDKTTEVETPENYVDCGQADSIFLVVLNPRNNTVNVLGLNRNTVALVDIYDESGDFLQSGYAQICIQHSYGDSLTEANDRTLSAVSHLLYDLPINSVTSVNMGAIAKFTDAVGGITVQCLETFDYAGFSYIKGETTELYGNRAYEYVHYRNMDEFGSANQRLDRQIQYLWALEAKTMGQIKADPGIVVDLYDVIQKYTVTDLSLSEITYIGTELAGYNFGTIDTFPGNMDTSGQYKYERFKLDELETKKMIIKYFYEPVE